MAGDPQFIQCFASMTAAGSTKNSFTTAASVLNSTDVQPLPGNWLRAGARFKMHYLFGISNVVTAQPTFTFQVMIGATAVFSSGAITTNATANTLLPCALDVEMRLDVAGNGTSAQWIGSGVLIGAPFASGSTAIVVPVATPADGSGYDSTSAGNLDFYVACQTSNSGNAVKLYDYSAYRVIN